MKALWDVVASSVQPSVRGMQAWSAQQEAIFEWFAHGAGHLLVRARAGTGKTTTILEAITRAPELRTLLVAFNKRIADELTARLATPRAEARTLHSLGFAVVRSAWPRVRVDHERGERLVRRAWASWCGRLPEAMLRAQVNAVGRLASLIKNLYVSIPQSLGELVDLADGYGIDLDEAGFARPEDVAALAVATCWLALEEDGTIDYDDMPWLPVVHGWRGPAYGLVVVDEAQDLNAVQLALARQVANGGRIVVVGDDRQCHPPGTRIHMTAPSGCASTVRIEKITGDTVVQGWNRKAQKMLRGRRATMAARDYEGSLIRVIVGDRRDNRAVEMTPNHRVLCRWADRHLNVCVTYLMYRREFGFRVGWCTLFANATRVCMFHLAHRARLEQAERTWVLSVHETRTDASVYERIVAGRYGLPTVTFEPPNGTLHDTATSLWHIFRALSAENVDRGRQALNDHGRAFELPLYPWPGHTSTDLQGRRTYFEVYASNLLEGVMSVAIPDARNAWRPIACVTERPYVGPVYSLDVERDHSYAANGIVVLNSLYQFRGADAHALDRMKAELHAAELPLTTTYRCPRRVVERARQLVLDYEAAPSAPDGCVITCSLDDTVAQAAPGDFVLSRLNAPLAGLALRLIRAGKPASVAGRDTAQQLVSMVARWKVETTEALTASVAIWLDQQRARARRAGQGAQEKLARAEDLAETIEVLAEGTTTVGEVLTRIRQIFGEHGEPHIVLSTVHRAKGLEADRVFVLVDTLYCRGKRTTIEEANIHYVALTRARQTLVLVSNAPAAGEHDGEAAGAVQVP